VSILTATNKNGDRINIPTETIFNEKILPKIQLISMEIDQTDFVWGDPYVQEDVFKFAAAILEPNGTLFGPTTDLPYFQRKAETDGITAYTMPDKLAIMNTRTKVLWKGMPFEQPVIRMPTLFPHQIEALEIWKKLGRRGLWAHDMGLGKTFAGAYMLYVNTMQHIYRKSLVITLASIIPKWSALLTSMGVPHIVIDKDTDTLNIPENMVCICSSSRFRKLRPDKNWTDKEKERFERKLLINRISPSFYPGQFDFIIYDESHALNTLKNLIYDFMIRMVLPETHLLLMSGTPFGNGFHEVFPQMNLIKPGIFHTRTQGEFRKFYCEDVSKDTRFSTWRVKSETRGILMRNIETKTDFRKNVPGIKLPPFREDDIPYHLSAYQKTLLKSITKKYVLPLPENAPAWLTEMCPTGVPLTSHPLIMHMKRMLCSGVLRGKIWVPGMPDEYMDKGYELYYEFPSPKNDLLLDILNGMPADQQSIIWISYRATAALLLKLLKKKGLSIELINGTVSERKKLQLIADFQNCKYQHLLSHPGSIGTGLDFFGATIHTAHEIPHSCIHYEQAKKRSHRIGQNKPVTMLRLYGHNSIEKDIVKALDNKIDFLDTLYSDEKKQRLPKSNIQWKVSSDA